MKAVSWLYCNEKKLRIKTKTRRLHTPGGGKTTARKYYKKPEPRESIKQYFCFRKNLKRGISLLASLRFGNFSVQMFDKLAASTKFGSGSHCLWSRITKFSVAARTKNVSVRDPASRFRLLTKHRCGFTKSTKPRAVGVFVSFCDPTENRTLI